MQGAIGQQVICKHTVAAKCLLLLSVKRAVPPTRAEEKRGWAWSNLLSQLCQGKQRAQYAATQQASPLPAPASQVHSVEATTRSGITPGRVTATATMEQEQASRISCRDHSQRRKWYPWGVIFRRPKNEQEEAYACFPFLAPASTLNPCSVPRAGRRTAGFRPVRAFSLPLPWNAHPCLSTCTCAWKVDTRKAPHLFSGSTLKGLLFLPVLPIPLRRKIDLRSYTLPTSHTSRRRVVQ